MRFLKIFLGLIIFCLLTTITQVGGIVFVISIMTFGLINKKFNSTWLRVGAKVTSFATLYLLFVFVIVPLAAKSFGRVRLPFTETNHVQPANIWTVLLNRNYVREELKQATFDVARKMDEKYPGTVLNYLDANFPFIDRFPLAPHLTHSDGEKLDISFHYIEASTGKYTDKVPSWLGYGVCEGPRPGEFDRPADCTLKGYWQYSFMSRKISQVNKDKYPFDPKRTRDLVNFFAAHNAIGRILIEPHLISRLKLTSDKLRLHGCIAVRHDDHIHVQLK